MGRNLSVECRVAIGSFIGQPQHVDLMETLACAADEIERLRVELRHCINELRSDTSRPPHRIRRAAVAEKVLHKKEGQADG